MMSFPFVYLDHNATTPLSCDVKRVLEKAMDCVGNPSSVHQSGRAVRKMIEEARSHVANYFSIKPAQIVFTSGATEANNLALKGFQGNIIVSAVEHDSVLESRSDLSVCSVDSSSVINLGHLEALLQRVSGPKLVSIMAANNETGSIQPLKEVVILAKKFGAFVHCDAVQALGKISIDWPSLDLDMISISAHKIGGLQGVGALIVNSTLSLTPQLRGGGQERFYRAGTENVLGIISLGEAIKTCAGQSWGAISQLRDRLESTLQNFCPKMTVFAQAQERLPNTSNLTMPGVSSSFQVMAFDLEGIAVSAGAACSSGKVKTSRVLTAMNRSSSEKECALRVSLGLQTTSDDIDRFISIWKTLYTRAHSQKMISGDMSL